MKCDKCGYYNPSDKNYCVKCGSPLENSAISRYKKSVQNKEAESKNFSTKEKLIIGLVIIGLLMLIVSAVMPQNLDLSKMINPDDDTPDENPVLVNDTVIEKIDTQISVGSIGIHENDKILVSAFVKDANDYPVNNGIASITINDVKYSGNVQNGNAHIIIPVSEVNNHTETLIYEGDETYNPSQTTVNLQVTKTETSMDYEIIDNTTIKATLKSVADEKISDAKINIAYQDNTVTQKQTDNNGEITFDIELQPGKNTIKLSYEGNELYGPCEKIIEIQQNKTETRMETQYDENKKTITVELEDSDNNPIRDAPIKIVENNTEKIEKTNNEGKIEIPLKEGLNEINVNYDGDSNYGSSNSSINTIIETNETDDTVNNTTIQDNETVENNTIDNNTANNTTANDTNSDNNTLENLIIDISALDDSSDNLADSNDTINQTTVNSTNTNNNTDNNTETTENNTNETDKIDTEVKHEIDKDNSTIKLNLITQDNQNISNEKVVIKFENGTEITEKTDINGTIILNIDDFSDIGFLEVIYQGNDEYNNVTEQIRIR